MFACLTHTLSMHMVDDDGDKWSAYKQNSMLSIANSMRMTAGERPGCVELIGRLGRLNLTTLNPASWWSTRSACQVIRFLQWVMRWERLVLTWLNRQFANLCVRARTTQAAAAAACGPVRGTMNTEFDQTWLAPQLFASSTNNVN